MYKKINFAHHKSIPIDYLQEFSHHYRLPIGTTLIAIYLAVFAYAIYYFYVENTTTEFVAIAEGNNRCTEVVRPLDGTFLASSNGLWEGDSAFIYRDAPINVIFRELRASKEYFQQFFTVKQKILEKVNYIFTKNNLAYNMLYWTSFKKSTTIGKKVQTFELVGDPSFIFNSPVTAGVLSSGTSVCNLLPSSIFNSESGKFTITYSLSDYISVTSGCREVLNEVTLAFAIPFLTTQVRIVIDSRSFMTAMALNMGIVNRDTNFDFDVRYIAEYEVDGYKYSVSNLKDISYPGMTPVFCVADTVCAVQVGEYLALPVFDHWGDNLADHSKPCNCSTGNGISDWCNTFDFILGFLVIGMLPDKLTNTSSSSAVDTIKTGLSIMQRYQGSYAAFNADWAPVVRAQLSHNRDTTYLKGAFVYKNHSLISIRSISSNLRIISEYAYELTNGSCNGALKDILLNWDNLSANPPKPLLEPYIKCYRNIVFSTVDALGLGMADCDLLMRFIAYLALPIILLLIRYCTGVPMLNPAGDTIESLTDILHRTRQRLRRADGSSSKSHSHSSWKFNLSHGWSSSGKGGVGGGGGVSVSVEDKAAATEIIRLLSIALNEEDEGEGDRDGEPQQEGGADDKAPVTEAGKAGGIQDTENGESPRDDGFISIMTASSLDSRKAEKTNFRSLIRVLPLEGSSSNTRSTKVSPLPCEESGNQHKSKRDLMSIDEPVINDLIEEEC